MAIDEYTSISSDDPRSGLLPYSQLQARRAIAVALATRNRPYPKTIGEGLTALGEGIGEGMYNNNLAGAEAAQQRYNRGIAPDLSGLGTATPRPSGGAALEGGDTATRSYAMVPPDAAPDTGPVFDPSKLSPEDRQKLEQARAYSGPHMPIEEWKQRIARNESGSRKDAYTLVGERSRRGDYPYGKYQVMGENIPKWTRAYYGKELTPEEFLANPEAQERVADGQGGKYLSKYGPEGAGAAWFAGEGGMNDPNRKDTLGTHVAEYKRRFNIPLVSRDQVVASAARATPDPESAAPYQVASLGDGVQTRETAVPDPREAVAQTLAGPPPQQIAQAGPAPLPTQSAPALPSVQQRPIQGPVQEVRPVPAGPQPQPGDYIRANPQLAQQVQKLKQIEADPRTQPEHATIARETINKIEQRANDADKNAWTIWHERTKVQEAFDLAAEERKRKREEHEKGQQGLITGAGTAPPVDPRVLGTPQSPQRSGIPDMPPKPSHLSQTDWATQQAPELKKAIAAVNDAEPDFKSMLKVIDQIRNHPGMEWGTGLFAGYAPRGTDAYAFSGGPEEGLIGQLKGKTFLTAYDKLRGGGSIATVEGSKATQAQAAVNPAAGKDAVHKALNNLEDQIRSDFETVQRRTNRPVTAWQKSNEDEVAPDKGQIVSGFSDGKTREYIGGNPRDLTGSWKIVR